MLSITCSLQIKTCQKDSADKSYKKREADEDDDEFEESSEVVTIEGFIEFEMRVPTLVVDDEATSHFDFRLPSIVSKLDDFLAVPVTNSTFVFSLFSFSFYNL